MWYHIKTLHQKMKKKSEMETNYGVESVFTRLILTTNKRLLRSSVESFHSRFDCDSFSTQSEASQINIRMSRIIYQITNFSITIWTTKKLRKSFSVSLKTSLKFFDI